MSILGDVTRPSRTVFDMWVVYEHPRDYPDKYVARLWVGDHPSIDHVVLADQLDELRELLFAAGRFCLERLADDDPIIVEVWL